MATNYQGKATQSPPKQNAVVSKPASVKKSNGFEKFVKKFIAEDIEDVGSYIINDVLIPGAKNVFLDGLAMLLTGETMSRSSVKTKSGSKVSYESYYNQKKKAAPTNAATGDFNDLIFDTRPDAECVLTAMFDHLEEYGNVSINDMYDFAGIEDRPYTHCDWGWTNLGSADVKHVRDGYALSLPRPRNIK